MNHQLKNILESLLTMISVLDQEILRLSRTGQITGSKESLQLIENIRGLCTETLQNLRTVEHRIHAKDLLPPKGE